MENGISAAAHRPISKTTSRFVSDAFSFLDDNSSQSNADICNGNEGDDSQTENMNGNSSVLKNNIQHGMASNFQNGYADNGIVGKDTNGVFTIVTSVDDTSESDCKLKANSIMPSDDYKIIDYVDRRKTHYINPVYVVDDAPETSPTITNSDEVKNNHTSASDGNNMDSDNKQVGNMERNSIIIDGEEVFLRKSPNDQKRRSSRQQTWKTNQNVVSEVFGFLKEVDDNEERESSNSISDCVNENINSDLQSSQISRSERQSTWKTNQRMVSQAFGFLKDIPDVNDRDSNESPIITELQTDVTDSAIMTSETSSVKNSQDYDASETSQQLENESAIKEFSSDKTRKLICLQQSSNNECKNLTNENDSPKTPNLQRASKTSSIASELGELGGYKKSKSRSNTGDDDGDSSDEDVGFYRESFRKSTWLYIGDKGADKSDDFVPLTDLGLQTCDDDSVFGDNRYTSKNLSESSHLERSESTSTTVSERDFRNNFNSVSKRFVQRAESQQEYKRYTQKFYDNVETYNIEKTDRDSFGIHILDSKPAIVSGVDAGSPAETAGLREGQIVISVNGVNVLDSDHDEIIQLVHKNGINLTLEVGGGSMSPVLDLQKPVLTGHLQKQTSSTLFRLWKKRYFILRRDNCLYYYKTEQDTDPLGAIPMYGYAVSRHGDTNKFGFKAEKYNNKTFYFMADSREEMTRWVGALNDVAKQQEDHKDSWMEVTAHNVGLPALEIRKPDCTGYLNKIGRSTKRWRKRYCVLKDACIYYYKNSNSKEALGVAHLHGYRVEKAGLSSKKFSFCLEPPEPEMRVFMFYAENETDKLRWIDALTVSIQKWIKVD